MLILFDDAGFGNPSTFGGPVQTPTLEKLATERIALQSLSRDRVVFTDACGALVWP